MENILVTICARGGSKGIPGKNTIFIGGVPLMAFTINIARKFAAVNNGYVSLSTDSIEIKKIAAQCGLESDYIRPSELATDIAGKIDAVKHLLIWEEKRRGIKYDYILDLDITSPLRTLKELNEAYKIFRSDNEALNLFSVSKPHRNPYFNVVEKAENGYYRLVKTPKQPVKSRQTAPEVYDLNASFYFYRRIFFDMDFENAYTPRSMIYLVDHICFDLDEPIDFLFLEYLINNKKLDFDFSDCLKP